MQAGWNGCNNRMQIDLMYLFLNFNLGWNRKVLVEKVQIRLPWSSIWVYRFDGFRLTCINKTIIVQN